MITSHAWHEQPPYQASDVKHEAVGAGRTVGAERDVTGLWHLCCGRFQRVPIAGGVLAADVAGMMQIRQVRDAAAAETAAVKQQLQRVQAAQAAEGEAAQAGLREKVAALERELFTLKDRYSRQFIDYKLKLDVSEDRIRRLRRELAERGPGEPAPPPPPVPAVGPGEGEPPGAGGADALQGGASSVEDVSTWASQLVTKLSEESGSGAAPHDLCRGCVKASARLSARSGASPSRCRC